MLAFLPLLPRREIGHAAGMDQLFPAGAGFGAMILLAALGPRFGFDSRDGFDLRRYKRPAAAPKKPSRRAIARPDRLMASITTASAQTASTRPELKYLNSTTDSNSVPGPDSSTTELRAREKLTNRMITPASSAGLASGST